MMELASVVLFLVRCLLHNHLARVRVRERERENELETETRHNRLGKCLLRVLYKAREGRQREEVMQSSSVELSSLQKK